MFFADSENPAARSAAGFWGILWGKPCATFVALLILHLIVFEERLAI